MSFPPTDISPTDSSPTITTKRQFPHCDIFFTVIFLQGIAGWGFDWACWAKYIFY